MTAVPHSDDPRGERGLLYIVSAPSGAGKTSLVHALVTSTQDLVVSVSHTTRPMRPGEVDGVNYHFVDHAAFEAMVEAGAFLEHATVFDHYYGTARASVDAELVAGRDVVLEIDWQGAQQVRARVADAVSIFILPPSYEELHRRLAARAGSTPETIERRMRDARTEISHYEEYAYLVVNDHFATALADLQAIVRAGRLGGPRQGRRLEHILDGLLAGAENP